VTIGSGAATTLTQTGAANVHTVGAAFGLTLTALMYSMSHTGASQFNPIVSVALMLCQHLSSAQCFLNIFFQVRARLAFTDRAGGEAEQAAPEQELGGARTGGAGGGEGR
jgi:glycerol uptake facilitator-like aquaporin